MDSKFCDKEYTRKEKFNIFKNNFFRKIKNNKEVSIFIGLLVIIFSVIIIFLNVLTIPVLNNVEIRKILIGRTINVKGEEINITDSNLKEVVVINRSTKKNKTDVVDIEYRISLDNSEAVEEGTINFIYSDNRWLYSSGDIENLKEIEAGTNAENFIKETIQKEGINTVEGTRYHVSSIMSVTNIKCNDYSVEGGQTFTADITLSNSAYNENCKINGKILINNENKILSITSVNKISEDMIKKEDEVDQNILKNIVVDEISDGSLYELKGDNSSEFVSISKDMIKELNIKNYIIRDDDTVRVEVVGDATSDKFHNINFSGFVSIGGNPSYGTIRNSKDIFINSASNDVPK